MYLIKYLFVLPSLLHFSILFNCFLCSFQLFFLNVGKFVASNDIIEVVDFTGCIKV